MHDFSPFSVSSCTVDRTLQSSYYLTLTFLNACLDHGPAFGGDLQVGGDAKGEVVRGPETRQSPCLLEALLDGSLSLQARR